MWQAKINYKTEDHPFLIRMFGRVQSKCRSSLVPRGFEYMRTIRLANMSHRFPFEIGVFNHKIYLNIFSPHRCCGTINRSYSFLPYIIFKKLKAKSVHIFCLRGACSLSFFSVFCFAFGHRNHVSYRRLLFPVAIYSHHL